MLDRISQYIKTHERLLLAALILAVVLFCGNKYLNISDNTARTNAAIAVVQLKDEKEANTQLATQSDKSARDYQAIITTMQQQNASLVAAVTQRNANLANQQQNNNSMPLPNLALRWKNLVPSADVTVAGAGLAVNDEGARSTVNQLEKVPVLEANLKDTQQIADNRQSEIDKGNVLIGDLNKQVTGLNLTVAGQDKACKAEVAQVKADDRKSKVGWFKTGFGLGFISGLFVGHKIP